MELPEYRPHIDVFFESRGLAVAKVGDGLSGAPAPAETDVGTAIGAGTGVAVESDDIVLVLNNPRDVVYWRPAPGVHLCLVYSLKNYLCLSAEAAGSTAISTPFRHRRIRVHAAGIH